MVLLNRKIISVGVAMQDTYKIYSGENLSNTYVVISDDTYPEVIPFNLRYLFGDMLLVKGSITESFLPFGTSGRKKNSGYCIKAGLLLL